jgi:hypothetical protein
MWCDGIRWLRDEMKARRQEGGMMTDLSELNKDTPAVGNDNRGTATDEVEAHRRVEREADKAAERGKDRQRSDDIHKILELF